MCESGSKRERREREEQRFVAEEETGMNTTTKRSFLKDGNCFGERDFTEVATDGEM